MDQGDDPYQILDVSKNAEANEIKSAYRKLAMKHHPDRQKDESERRKAQDRFAKISAAYEILGDEKKRKSYDTLQREQKSRTGRAKGFDQRDVDICFNSPYEVFKRDFEAQWGFPYPGAQWDFDCKTKHIEDDRTRQSKNKKSPKLITDGTGRKNTSRTQQSSSNRNSSSNNNNNRQRSAAYDDHSDSSDSNSDVNEDSKPRRSFFPFRKSNNKETSIVPHKNSSNSSSNRRNGSNALVKRNGSTENQLVKSYGVEGDNRPISMLTTRKEIQHKDGTVETVTETKMTRPDGSVETVRTSDKAEKHKDWRQPEKMKHKQLTNGETRKAITNGEKQRRSSSSTKSSKKPLAITNGPSSSSSRSSGRDTSYSYGPSESAGRDTSYSYVPSATSSRMSLR